MRYSSLRRMTRITWHCTNCGQKCARKIGVLLWRVCTCYTAFLETVLLTRVKDSPPPSSTYYPHLISSRYTQWNFPFLWSYSLWIWSFASWWICRSPILLMLALYITVAVLCCAVLSCTFMYSPVRTVHIPYDSHQHIRTYCRSLARTRNPKNPDHKYFAVLPIGEVDALGKCRAVQYGVFGVRESVCVQF